MFAENENKFEDWPWQYSVNKIKLLKLQCVLGRSTRKGGGYLFLPILLDAGSSQEKGLDLGQGDSS